MQDVDLFLSLAEIAGVFAGFGALISVRSGGASDAHEVVHIRAVVWIGIWVVVAALAPVHTLIVRAGPRLRLRAIPVDPGAPASRFGAPMHHAGRVLV
jgi:hypothetical protein